MKKVFITFLSIVGLIVTVVACLSTNQKNRKIKSKKEIQEKNSIEIKKGTILNQVLDLSTNKKEFSNNISKRHKEAANIIRESISTVKSCDKNMSKLKKDFEDLDKNLDVILD